MLIQKYISRTIINENGVFAGLSKLVGDANSKSEKIRESLLDPSITNNVSKVNKTKMHKNMI